MVRWWCTSEDGGCTREEGGEMITIGLGFKGQSHT
jgi:hypothetical protein